MTTFSRRSFVAAGAAGASFALLGSLPGAFAQDSARPTVRIGSKNFTESILLGEIVAQLIEDADYRVDRTFNLGGTVVAHEALVAGDIDTYVEYTGTGLLAILGQELPESLHSADAASSHAGATPVAGVDPVYDIVAQEYAEQFNIEWLEPWGFNNTYALAMRGDHVAELGIVTISDLAGHAGELTFGATQEFLVREDGLPGLEATYDITFGNSVGMEPGLMYNALAKGDVDVISAFATDGRVPAMDFVLLDDDQGFFPPYYAAPVVRQDLLEKEPGIADVLNSLAGTVSDEDMAKLNYEVDDGGKEPVDVARAFLQERNLIAG